VETGPFSTSQSKTFTITSTGTTNLQASPIEIEGDDSEDFTFVSSPNCGFVAAGSTCPVEVRFAPQPGDPGTRSAELVIGNNTRDDDPVTIPLTGTATTAHVTPDPASIDFGDVDPYDETAPTRTLELNSDGTAGMVAIAYFGDLSGLPDFQSGPFSVNGEACYTSGEELVLTPPGESCDLTVTFNPSDSAPGTHSETLHLFTNGNAVDVPLSGRVTQGGASSSSDSVDVGDVELGQTGSVTFTLTSTGTAPLKLEEPVIDGPDAGMFSVDQPASCDGLTEGQTCDVTVDFSPSSIAGKQAGLTLSGNFGSIGVQLAGRGIQALVNAPTEISFPQQKVGSSTTQTATLISNGDAPFTLDSLTIEGADASMFSVQPRSGGCSGLVRGEECDFTVTYQPTTAGSHVAELRVEGNIETQTIPLTGSARALSPAKISMKLRGPKKVKRGKTLTLSVKVTNKGEASARNVTLKTKVPKKLAKAVKAVKIKSIPSGKTVSRKIKVRVKRSARKGARLKVKVKASGPGIKGTEGARVAKLR
jgi:uncharacterized repeat protein (TIGR01451 family)